MSNKLIKPKFSIIIPTYNAIDTLERALLSVLSQTYQNLEVLVIDGGSVDGTIDYLKSMGKKDGRIKWVSEPDNGIYDAMNKGVNIAEGEWLYFMGADDWLACEKVLNTLFSISDVNEYVIISGHVLYKGRIIGQKPRAELMLNGFPHQATFFRKDLFIKYSYDLQYNILADQVLFMQLYSENKNNWYYIDFVIAIYSTGGVSTNPDKQFLRNLEGLTKLYLNDELEGRRLYVALRKRALENIKYGSVLLGLKWLILSGIDLSYFRDTFYCLRFRALRAIKITFR